MSGAGVMLGYFEKFTSSRFPNNIAPCIGKLVSWINEMK